MKNSHCPVHSAVSSGLAVFDSLGTMEYSIELSYNVIISGGKFTNLYRITFNVTHLSFPTGSWGNVTYQSYCNDYYCGVTANYYIYKSITIPIFDFSVDVRTESDFEFFTLYATIPH